MYEILQDIYSAYGTFHEATICDLSHVPKELLKSWEQTKMIRKKQLNPME